MKWFLFVGLIAPIEPFRTANRFTTATVFGILAFEVLKIFEELLFSTADPFNRGILIELLERIAMVFMIGYDKQFFQSKNLSKFFSLDFVIIPYLLHYNYEMLP